MADSTADPDDDAPVFTAREMLAYRWRSERAPQVPPPPAAIICYQREAITALFQRRRAVKVKGLSGEFSLLKMGQHSIGVLHPGGPGAPALAAALEELIAFGVKRFISVGVAGGLQPDLQSGDIVVCNAALRDEGTSFHYLPPTRMVEADPTLIQQLCAALASREIIHTLGASWTTDAPYRETRREVEAHHAEGLKAVDMEAAALFAVGQRLGTATAAVLVIGDRLADLTWRPPPDSRSVGQRLGRVAQVVGDFLGAG